MEKTLKFGIKNLEVFGFKSIQFMKLSDLRKINLFIGSPNAGKTSLFEAMSLFCLPDLMNDLDRFSPIDIIRFDSESELFHNGFIGNQNAIEVEFFDKMMIVSALSYHEDRTCWLTVSDEATKKRSQMRLSRTNAKPARFDFPIKRYVFLNKFNDASLDINKSSLQFPFGPNLFQIIRENEELRSFVKEHVEKFQLKILINPQNNSIQFIKPSSSGDFFVLPYASLADTLQRLIFFKAAICTNKNKVLLFEEPEAHAFPPYMSYFTQEVISDKTNQFFISTHSPYIINEFIESIPNKDDLSIHILHMVDGETKAVRLDQKEINEINQYGIDLLLNLENYT